jgi:TATA-binding protein-associated factor
MLQICFGFLFYERLDGTISCGTKRSNIIKRFNEKHSTIDVLLLTTSLGGHGLNLIGADTVIFLEHSWNPFIDLQAMDRTHRLGQQKIVRVFRLIMKNTIEEQMIHIQNNKQNISYQMIQEINPSQSMNSKITHLLQNFLQKDISTTMTSTTTTTTTSTSTTTTCSTSTTTTTSSSSSSSSSVMKKKKHDDFINVVAPDDKNGHFYGLSKEILDQIGELWDEKQYDSLQFPSSI